MNRMIGCVCDCGNKKEVRLVHLVRLKIQSCGCLPKVMNGESNTNLGKRWRAMIERCHLRTDKNYRDRGISVCDEWKNSFPAFKEWAMNNGYRKDLTIDRIDNDGNYEPNNCRWVTIQQNCNNRRYTHRVTYKGREYPLTELLSGKGLMQSYGTIRRRMERGWRAERAIDTPIRVGNYKKTKNYFNVLKYQRLP